MLKRCQAASTISITLEGKQGNEAFEKAFEGPRGTFGSVKQLTCTEKWVGFNAGNLYKACTTNASSDLQVTQCCRQLMIRM